MGGRPLKGLLFVGALIGLSVAASSALAGLGPNPADHRKLIDKPLESYRYDYGRRCKQKTPRGTRALVRWLDRRMRGSSWGVYRCEKLSRGNYSLHAERRAIDWAIDAGRRKEKRQAMKLIKRRLLATDRRGNRHALARRMGVQGVIFNCRAWWSGMSKLGRYSYCFKANGKRKRKLDRTAAHKDHIHIELNKPGARGKTSFWRSGLR